VIARESCAACGGEELRLHLRVARQSDQRELIPTTTRFGTAPADIFRCAGCGHRQVSPVPPERALTQAYVDAESFDYVIEEAGQRSTARRWLEQLEAHASARGELLDLGCWVGYLLSEAEQRGWRATGVEPSAFASEFARRQLGVEVITGDLFSAPLAAQRFDVVTMNDVIEHLVGPGEAVARVRALLRPGGLIGLVLPDAGSKLARVMGRRWWSVIPTHVQYFTRNSIRVLLERHGFELLSITTAPKVFTVRYYLERIAGYSGFAARMLTAAAAAAGAADRLWAPDFRDRMAVIARGR
jgi:SAM-dependent methyltransferase